jgi:HEAT repeat protein
VSAAVEGLDPHAVRALVRDRLDRYAGDFLLSALWRGPLTLPDPAAYRAQVTAEMAAQHGRTLAALATPPEPGLIRIKSWQYGFTDAASSPEADRALCDALFLALQAYPPDYRSSADWRAGLEALDQPARWLAHAGRAEAAGRLVEANAAIAAARWLDPAADAAEILAAREVDGLPARFAAQPDASYAALPLGKRHWRAWDMKNYGLLDLPTLIAHACDASFSIRTRIYRSLGQQPHPAAIQVLQEGTLDPHWFARAQAVRSLGWIRDPSFIDRLRTIALRDGNAEVRRTARLALERIVGYWRCHGEWNEIAGAPARALDVIRALVADGMAGFAGDLASILDVHLSEADERAIFGPDEELEELDAPERHYTYHFEEAAAYEERLAAAEPSDAARGLASTDAEAQAFALDIVGRHHLTDHLPQVIELAAAPDAAVSFAARRTLRRLDAGSIAQRRWCASEWGLEIG